jgi:Phage tail protein
VSVYTPYYGPVYSGPLLTVSPGGTATLELNFTDSNTGLPADPASVELDITYGLPVGFAPDVAGPYYYTGASGPVAGEVYRTGVGQYAFSYQVPWDAYGGVYVASWTCSYGGSMWEGTEDFAVTGGTLPSSPPSGDTGYWTGSLSYGGNTVSFGQVDDNGICWLWNGIDGWDGPDVSGGIIQRSGDHGGWASPQFYAPRTLTLRVTAIAPSQALRDLARALLSQVVPVSDLAVLNYDEPVPLQAQVRRSGKITEKPLTLTDVQFTVGLVAPDPRKYSQQVHSVTTAAAPTGLTGLVFPVVFPVTFPAMLPAGIVSVANAGNFETRPLITITGPVTSPSLTSLTTGQTVSWTGLVLNAGSALTVDFLNRVAYDQNGSYWPADLASSWWVMGGQVPGGAVTEIQLGGAAGLGAQFIVQWQDSWV